MLTVDHMTNRPGYVRTVQFSQAQAGPPVEYIQDWGRAAGSHHNKMTIVNKPTAANFASGVPTNTMPGFESHQFLPPPLVPLFRLDPTRKYVAWNHELEKGPACFMGTLPAELPADFSGVLTDTSGERWLGSQEKSLAFER